MEIKVTKQNNVTIVELSGNLDGNTVTPAQDQIMPLLTVSAALVLDMKSCGYVSSAGLRLLLMAAKQLSLQNGVLVLSGLSPEIKDVMEMTGFNNFFKTFDSVEAAIAVLPKGA
jgi:anti-anti-sigma factor